MQTIKVNINKISQPAQVLKELRKKKLRKGATLKLTGSKPDENLFGVFIFIAIALAVLFTKKKEYEMEENLLKDLLKDYKTTDELEKRIEKEYSVNIEIEQVEKEDDDEEDFRRFAMQNLARAYDDDEPDYSSVKLLETNPTYIGWKKGK